MAPLPLLLLLSSTTADRPDPACRWHFTHADLSQITSPWRRASARAKAAVSAGSWGGREEVAGAIKMAPLMIIIHCLLFLLSSTLAPTPPAFLSSPCRGPARHVHQLSPGCSESMGSGGRRLVNSPEAAWCSWSLIQTKRTCKHTYSCCLINPDMTVSAEFSSGMRLLMRAKLPGDLMTGDGFVR